MVRVSVPQLPELQTMLLGDFEGTGSVGGQIAYELSDSKPPGKFNWRASCQIGYTKEVAMHRVLVDREPEL